MTHFVIDQSAREALTTERAKHLLSSLDTGTTSAKLSGKSFGDGSAEVAAAALQRALPTLTHLDIADIIASRSEEEAKRTLATIADALSSCKQLQFIDLSDNALGAKGIRAVGGLLQGQPRLESLLLCNNGLAADAGELIAAALVEDGPTALVKLHFHNNLLETAGSVALAPVVESSPKLENFRFSSLRLGREGAVRICTALRPRIAATLKHLNLSDNTFGEEGAEALTESLERAPLLETLLLRDAALGDEGVKSVCEALVESAPNLTVLDVSGNEVAIEGATSLASLFAKGSLKEVLAEDNELGSSGAVKLAKGLKAGSRLEVLNVCSSEIGGRGAVALAKAAAKVDGLKILAMNANTIPEEMVSTIEELLGDRLGSLSDNDVDDEDEDEDEEDEDKDKDKDEEEKEEVEETVNGHHQVNIANDADGKVTTAIDRESSEPLKQTSSKAGDKDSEADVDELTAKIESIKM